MTAHPKAVKPPEVRCSTIDRELLHLALFVGEDRQVHLLQVHRFDVAADCRLVAGEIAELVREDLKPSGWRFTPTNEVAGVGATRALVAKL